MLKSGSPKISVIIPVLNESKSINAVIDYLMSIGSKDEFEIIVVDGSSHHATIAAMRDDYNGVFGITSEKGRAIQMNAGAYASTGDILLFLHADTTLPLGAFNDIRKMLNNSSFVGGAFELKLDASGLFYKIISSTGSLRSKLTKIPQGDQAIFMRKNYFVSIGGFKNIPLMEDTELMKRIKKRGDKIGIVDKPILSSARRWKQYGKFRTTIKNHVIRLLYALGVSPDNLAKMYDKNYVH
jgi:rSAM/selenodomain-associated transferase 2